jgi:hypothetical protein
MDSSAYKVLIESLQSSVAADPSFLPYSFVKQPVSQTKEAWLALTQFLNEQITGTLTLGTDNRIPTLFKNPEWGSSLIAAHQTIINQIRSGAADQESPAQTAKGIPDYFCADQTPEREIFIAGCQPLDQVMLVALLEGFLFCGVCPHKQEGKIKSAAHALFAELKKSLYKATPEALSAITAYLWGAWLCAQKTEGILDK